jgi:hypothetical protein
MSVFRLQGFVPRRKPGQLGRRVRLLIKHLLQPTLELDGHVRVQPGDGSVEREPAIVEHAAS